MYGRTSSGTILHASDKDEKIAPFGKFPDIIFPSLFISLPGIQTFSSFSQGDDGVKTSNIRKEKLV